MNERRSDEVRRSILDEILAEREAQRHRELDHEDTYRPVNDWPGILSIWLGKAAQETPLYRGKAFNKKMFRNRIVQIAAICIAALESLDGET